MPPKSARKNASKNHPADSKAVRENVDLNWAIGQSLQAAAERLTSGDIDVDLDLNLQIPKISGTRASLSQVFDSLLTHSSAAFDRLDDDRERKIRIATRLHSDDEVEVLYADNAGGIAKNVEQNMVQPLLPVELQKGNGGVWIKKVFSIVSDHRGTITLDTDEGVGSTFTFRFPLK